MARAKFISEAKLKEDSYINGNVDNKILGPLILECQEFYILPIIGTGIYNQIIAQINASNVSVLNKTLLDDYVIPCLVRYIQYEAPIYLNYKFANSSVAVKNTDESVPVTMEEAQRIMYRLKDKAEWYAERITKYLVTNQVDYPLFTNPGSTVDTIHPNRANYTSGMFLGDRYPNCNCEGKCFCMTNMKTSSPN
jgi:hypothetical protein